MLRALAAVPLLASIAALAAGCAGSRQVSAAELRAIAQARHAYRGLAIFPLRPETIRCRMPYGGAELPGTGVPGRCTTTVRPATRSGRIEVVFSERGTYPTSGGVAPIAAGGRWTVTVDRSGVVLGYRVTGDPPQLQK